MTTGIGERLVLIRGSKSQLAFAEEMGVNKNTIGSYERGQSRPDSDFLLRLVEMGINPNWLITGRGEMLISDIADPGHSELMNQVDEEHGRYDALPLYEIRASAGHGAEISSEKVVDSLAFKRDWIRNTLNAKPEDLALIYVKGESMEPTLKAGDVIMIDKRGAETVLNDGIYVLRLDGSLMVKRLQRLPDRKVRVGSDNPAYQSFEIELDKPPSDLAIIGRVVWSGRHM